MAASMAVRFKRARGLTVTRDRISALSLQTLVEYQEPEDTFRKAQQLGLLGHQPRPGRNRPKSL